MNQTTNGTKSNGSCRCKTAEGFSDDGNLRSSHEHASITQRYISAPPTSPKISLAHIPTGWRGTQSTLEHIQALIRAGAKDFLVRQKAIDILLEKYVKPKDYLAEIMASSSGSSNISGIPRTRIRSKYSIRRSACWSCGLAIATTWRSYWGRCWKQSGHPVRLVIIGSNPLRHDFFTHIYLEVFHKGRWISLDATMPYPMGWAPRTMVKKIITIERRPTMMSEDLELHGIGAGVEVPAWLKGLIRAIRSEAMQPKDERVKSLWNILRARQQLSTHPWLKEVLQRIWSKGLAARPRPLTTEKLVTRLRQIGILPPAGAGAGPADHRQGAGRSRAPMAMRPVRVVAVKPVRPMPMRAHR